MILVQQIPDHSANEHGKYIENPVGATERSDRTENHNYGVEILFRDFQHPNETLEAEEFCYQHENVTDNQGQEYGIEQ